MATIEHNNDDDDDDGGDDVRVLTMVPTTMMKSETATATSRAMMPPLPLPLPLPLPPPLRTMATRGRRTKDDKCDVDNPVDIDDSNLTMMMGL